MVAVVEQIVDEMLRCHSPSPNSHIAYHPVRPPSRPHRCSMALDHTSSPRLGHQEPAVRPSTSISTAPGPIRRLPRLTEPSSTPP